MTGTWAPSSIPLAGADPAPDHERIISSTRVPAGFNGGITVPQYFTAWDIVPPLQNRLPPGPGGKLEPVVEITLQALLQIDDPTNVVYAGIMGVRIAYGTFAGPALIGYGAGPVTPLWSLLLAGQSYDPTQLPVGGVNYPIWTRQAADPISANIRLDRSGPGNPLVAVDFQIFASTNSPDAVGVTLQQSLGAAS